jgi:cell division protein FtsL
MVLFVAIGSASVALTSNAVAILQCNNTLESYNTTLTAANDDLRIERSLLTRADRVSRIATQNLHMVYAQDAQHFELR